MNAITYTVRDSATMLRRQLRHMLRYPSLTVIVVGMPVVFLLLFVFVLGGTMGSGLGPTGAVGASGAGGGRSAYLQYVVPGNPGDDHRGRRPGNGDLGRHGHDRRHRGALPDHVHLPRLPC